MRTTSSWLFEAGSIPGWVSCVVGYAGDGRAAGYIRTETHTRRNCSVATCVIFEQLIQDSDVSASADWPALHFSCGTVDHCIYFPAKSESNELSRSRDLKSSRFTTDAVC